MESAGNFPCDLKVGLTLPVNEAVIPDLASVGERLVLFV
jgi:hypothetical protein